MLFLIVLPVRAPGCSAAAEERMQRGAGEITGQYEGCSEVLNPGVQPGVAKCILKGTVCHLGNTLICFLAES